MTYTTTTTYNFAHSLYSYEHESYVTVYHWRDSFALNDQCEKKELEILLNQFAVTFAELQAVQAVKMADTHQCDLLISNLNYALLQDYTALIKAYPNLIEIPFPINDSDLENFLCIAYQNAINVDDFELQLYITPNYNNSPYIIDYSIIAPYPCIVGNVAYMLRLSDGDDMSYFYHQELLDNNVRSISYTKHYGLKASDLDGGCYMITSSIEDCLKSLLPIIVKIKEI